MPLRIIYFLILNAFIVLFFNSCSTVQDAFDPQRKNSSEEFLVEKKSPLSMPPNFNELPVPQDTKNNNKDDIWINIGIAGHKTLKVGSIYEVKKVISSNNKNTFFTNSFYNKVPTSTVCCVNKEEKNSSLVKKNK